MTTAKQKMVRDFKVLTPDLTIGAAQERLSTAEAVYGVVTTSEGEPLAIVTAEQLREVSETDRCLKDALDILPVALMIDQNKHLSEIVEHFSPVLLGSREIKGLVVFHDGKVKGIVPRKIITEQANIRLQVRGGGGGSDVSAALIEGDIAAPPRTYVCPHGDYEETVTSYNRFNPPRCPYDKEMLVRKR
ncbi:MAG TPA: CBS domain-containing protein [Pyrinomonadaceae bacterium]|jgi:CBS domain-containing protein|nr:CBS domain-containing protein [Pyrinomonadaceae bacterium]